MAIYVLPPADVIARIQASVPTFKAVEGAAELEGVVKRGARITPSAYVVPLNESSGNNSTGSQVVSQRVTSQFAVAYAVKNLSDGRGAKAVEDLSTLRQATLAALVGWSPSPEFQLCQFDGGSLLRVADGTVIWRDKFSLTHVNEK